MDLSKILWWSVGTHLSQKSLFLVSHLSPRSSLIYKTFHASLLQRCTDIDAYAEDLFIDASEQGDLVMVLWLIMNTRVHPIVYNHAFHYSGKCGHLSLCQLLAPLFGYNEHNRPRCTISLFQDAARNGDLVMCKWLAAYFCITSDDLRRNNANQPLAFAACKGHRNVCEWMIRHFGFTKQDLVCITSLTFPILELSAEKGQHDLYQWMVLHFKVLRHDTDFYVALQSAATRGDLPFMKWLVSHFQLSLNDIGNFSNSAPSVALDYGHIHVCEWLCSKFGVSVPDLIHNEVVALQSLCHMGLLSACQWIFDHFGAVWSQKNISMFLRHGSLCANNNPLSNQPHLHETSKSIREQLNCALRLAVVQGHLYICEWLVDHFVYTSDDVVDEENQILCMACVYGGLYIFQWLVDTFQLSWDDVCANNKQTLVKIADLGHIKTCQWLVHRFNLDAQHVQGIFEISAAKGHLDICRWLANNFQIKNKDLSLKNASRSGNIKLYKWLVSRFNMKKIE